MKKTVHFSLFTFHFSLATLLLLAGSASAQRDTCQSWRAAPVDGVRSAGGISNVSCVDNRLYFSTADILFSIPMTPGGIADVDTLYAPLDREMNYVVKHPSTGNIHYTKRVGKRTQLYEIYTDDKGVRRSRQVKPDRFRGSIVHPTFSPDGRILVFSSDQEGGQGGFDLWYSLLGPGGWSEPRNLGPRVNSPLHEFSPTLWGDYLFFSTNRDSADFDIYATRLISTNPTHGDTAYTLPIGLSPLQRMPAPLNSGSNDFGIAFPPSAAGAYFVSRPEGATADRIYRLSGTVPCVVYQGTVANAASGEPVPHATLTALDPHGRPAYTAHADSLGRYRLYLPADSSLLVRIAAHHHLSLTESFLARPSSAELLHSLWTYSPTLQSYPLHRKQPLQAQTLFGSESGSDLTPEGIAALEPVVRFLKENPDLRLTLTAVYGRHRSDSYCSLLNRSRLQSLLQHLAKQGLRAADITTHSTVGAYQRTSSDNARFDNVILLQFD